MHMQTYQTFYAAIEKPFFAPPEWLFGLAWGIIYPLMAITFVYLIYLWYKKEAEVSLIWIFLVNLFFNILFTPLQLGLESMWWATIDILIVLGTLVYFQVRAWRTSKLVFALMLPYLLWGAFATVLQITITFMNM